jgi:MFS family permease
LDAQSANGPAPDEIKQLNWIITGFNLTAAAFLPFWAQLTDIFGRHLTIQAAMIVMMVGSAICTGAPTSAFGVLLLGRALQGIGAAGMNISVRTILVDRVSLSDYAINWTIFALVAGVSFSIGPVVGGYLTQASWRWCFAINLPISVVAIFLVCVLLHKELLGPQPLQELEGRDTTTRHGRLSARLSTIDYGGQVLFLWGLGLHCLALTWGGGTYSWNAAAVLAPLIIGGVLSIGWIFYEHSMSPGFLMSRVFSYQRAMMPWELLSQRDIGLLFFINFSVGMSMFAVMYFLDLYFALVERRSSGNAGVGLLYYLPGLGGMLTCRQPHKVY